MSFRLRINVGSAISELWIHLTDDFIGYVSQKINYVHYYNVIRNSKLYSSPLFGFFLSLQSFHHNLGSYKSNFYDHHDPILHIKKGGMK